MLTRRDEEGREDELLEELELDDDRDRMVAN